MRGDTVFRIYGIHTGREKDSFFGAFRTANAAQVEIDRLMAKEMGGSNWARQHHDRGFVIRETSVDTDFEIPARPKPRDSYVASLSAKDNGPGRWEFTRVEILRRDANGLGSERICAYERNYSMIQTFEPFRQGNRDFALISRDYTKTAVLDLASGEVIAEEGGEGSSAPGFCPVGFYVPDWWDLNDGSVIPGSEYWNAESEWPTGDFGFVWGCEWGDDSSWKVQYLDLSGVQQGIVRRDERFGYVELATDGYASPCLLAEPPDSKGSARPKFIDISRYNGKTRATFTVEMEFDLASGGTLEWQRLKVANFE